VLKLDELGGKAKTMKGLVCDADRRGKRNEKAINDYVRRLFVKKNRVSCRYLNHIASFLSVKSKPV